MSFYRENVFWKSRDDTWGMGVYDCCQTGVDPGWDVAYNFDTFMWASVGHASGDAAYQAWMSNNANLGGGEVASEPNAQTDGYDEMAKKCLVPNGWRP